MKDVLILGFGSEILSDESIVPRIFQQLKNEISEVEYSLYLTLSLDLLNDINGYSKIIVIDTVKTRQGSPGYVQCYSLRNYQPTLHLENIHDISFPDMAELGKLLDYSIPEDISIIAIEIVDHETITNELSPLISLAYTSIYSKVLQMIRSQITSVIA